MIVFFENANYNQPIQNNQIILKIKIKMAISGIS